MQIGNSDLAFLPDVTALMMNSKHNGPCWTPTAEGIILSTLESPLLEGSEKCLQQEILNKVVEFLYFTLDKNSLWGVGCHSQVMTLFDSVNDCFVPSAKANYKLPQSQLLIEFSNNERLISDVLLHSFTIKITCNTLRRDTPCTAVNVSRQRSLTQSISFQAGFKFKIKKTQPEFEVSFSISLFAPIKAFRLAQK